MLTNTAVRADLADAAQAALQAAATNASSTGIKTSEFWVSVLAAGGATLAGLLIPGVGGAIVAAVIGVGAAAYAYSRGSVKAAALAGASAGLAAAASSNNTTAKMSAALGQAALANLGGNLAAQQGQANAKAQAGGGDK